MLYLHGCTQRPNSGCGTAFACRKHLLRQALPPSVSTASGSSTAAGFLVGVTTASSFFSCSQKHQQHQVDDARYAAR